MDQSPLLNSKQMAQFVADGFLKFEGLIPDEINQQAMAELNDSSNRIPRPQAGDRYDNLWPATPGIGGVFRLPQVRAIVHSLVGPNPIYDHHAVHVVGPNQKRGQFWHADAIIDTRMHFDIQFFYFGPDTPREMGGTMILPGSHYRRVSESDISRYQNFVGQLPSVCKAGTLIVVHHGMWHCAQPNLTDKTRYMFKLRVNPTVKQVRLWDTSDIDDLTIGDLLHKAHPWYGDEHRIEVVNRIRMWRFITGNEKYDTGYWMTRLENMPENRLETAGAR